MTASPPDRALITAWATGWAIARAVPPPSPRPGGLHLLVNSATERTRHILFDLDPARLAAITATETVPPVSLKICGAPRTAVTPFLPAAWALEEQRHFMTSDLQKTIAAAPIALPNDFAMTSRTDGAVITIALRHPAGPIVASGTIVVLGRFAVADDIGTDPAYRRRGLGTRIMTALHRAATERGAETALLVATSGGRALYLATGWQERCLYTSCILRAATDSDQNAATSPNTASPTTTQVT